MHNRINEDAFNLPIDTKIKNSKITVDDLLLESDITKDFQKLLQTSKVKQNYFNEVLDQVYTDDQINDIVNSSQKTAEQDLMIKITDDDLLIEELLQGAGNMSDILKEIQTSDVVRQLEQSDDLKLSKQSSKQKQSTPEIPKPIYILDYINAMEKEPYRFLNNKTQNSDEHQSFLFTHYEHLLKPQKLKTFREIKIEKIQNQIYDLVSQKQSENRPKALSYFNDGVKEYIAIGTARSHLFIFIQKYPAQYTPGQLVKLQHDPSVQQSPIICIQFSDNGSYLLASNQNAQMIVFNIQNIMKPKFIKAFNAFHNSTPLCFQLYGDQMSNGSTLNFISTDNTGVVQINKIRKSTFSYGIEKSLLFDKKQGIIYQLERAELLSDKNASKDSVPLEAIAMAGQNQVMVIIVEPFIDLVFKRPYPQEFKTWVKWQSDSSSIKQQLHKPILSISNGNYIENILVIYKREKNKVDLKFQVHSRLDLNQSDKIEGLHWLSQNIIFAKLDKKKYYLLDITKFQSLEIKDSHIQNLDQLEFMPLDQASQQEQFQKALIIEDYLSYETLDQNYIPNIVQPSFINTLVSSGNKQILKYLLFIKSLIFLEQNQVQDINKLSFILYWQLSMWHDFVQVQINNLEWNQCLSLCLQMFAGKARFFAGLPLDDNERKISMRPFLNDIILRYIQEIAELQREDIAINQQDSWTTKIVTAIEFLTRTDQLDFLFNTLRQLFKRYGKDNIFLDSLEPFILKNQIKYIPKDALKDVIINLRTQRKLQILKQLIINLDISQLDSGQIIQICIEFNLFTPLLYISPRVDEDYLTPIVKMFSIYTQMDNEFNHVNKKGRTYDQISSDKILSSYQNNQILQYFQDQQILMPQSQKEMLKEIQIQGYRCLWYVHLCFIGELFPNERIPQNLWGRVMFQIIVFYQQCQQKQLLRFGFLQKKPYSCAVFKEISLLFQEEQLQVLATIESDLLTALQVSKKRNQPQNSPVFLDESSLINVNPIVNMIIEILALQIETFNKDSKETNEAFSLWLADMIIHGSKMRFTHGLIGTRHSIAHPFETLETKCLRRSYSLLNEEHYKEHGNKLFAKEEDDILLQKEQIIAQYLSDNQGFLLKNKQILDELQLLVNDSPLQIMTKLNFNSNELQAFLEFCKSNYQHSIDMLLHSVNQMERVQKFFFQINFIQIKCFKYIDRIVETLQDPKYRKELGHFIKYLLDNITHLVRIDALKVSKMLEKYNEEDFKQAIYKLNDFPELKYQLMNKIVSLKRSQGLKLEDKLMNQYFACICQLHPDKALDELQKGDFIQDECLKLCQQYKIPAGVAYVLEHSGKYIDALNMYFDVKQYIIQIKN